MKRLKISSLFMLLSLLSMGMGFPDIISEREIIELKKSKKQKEIIKAQMMSCSREIHVNEQHKPKQVSKKKPCIQTCSQATQLTQPIAEKSFISQTVSSLNSIATRVFNIIGNILLRQQIRVGNFLSSNYATPGLSASNSFVILHGKTADCVLDNEN